MVCSAAARAKRFGFPGAITAPESEEDKRKSRSERFGGAGATADAAPVSAEDAALRKKQRLERFGGCLWNGLSQKEK